MSEVHAAAVLLIGLAKRARKRLAGTNIMGQQLDRPLVEEIDRVVAMAERAIDEEAQRQMIDERTRQQIRDLSRRARS